MTLRNQWRNPILMTCQNSDLGSASDWLKVSFNGQWHVISMEFLYWFLRRHFKGKSVAMSQKCWLFSQANWGVKSFKFANKKIHSEIFYEKNELYTEKHGNLNLCGKETSPLATISASFQNPKRDKKNMPFGVPADTNMEELQPCPTGLFREKKDIPNIKHNY